MNKGQQCSRNLFPAIRLRRRAYIASVEEWIERQLRERQPPGGRPPVMFQRWLDLLFLHWMIDPEKVQRTLPRGLSVDTYQGMAWIGIVPFCMTGVRPVMLPVVSSHFLELNLRTYVIDRHGAPGVWFYSLDANHPFAVRRAQLVTGRVYHSPYKFKKAVVSRFDKYLFELMVYKLRLDRRTACCSPLR